MEEYRPPLPIIHLDDAEPHFRRAIHLHKKHDGFTIHPHHTHKKLHEHEDEKFWMTYVADETDRYALVIDELLLPYVQHLTENQIKDIIHNIDGASGFMRWIVEEEQKASTKSFILHLGPILSAAQSIAMDWKLLTAGAMVLLDKEARHHIGRITSRSLRHKIAHHITRGVPLPDGFVAEKHEDRTGYTIFYEFETTEHEHKYIRVARIQLH